VIVINYMHTKFLTYSTWLTRNLKLKDSVEIVTCCWVLFHQVLTYPL